jgi:tryptophanyl-tRNA synthetase
MITSVRFNDEQKLTKSNTNNIFLNDGRKEIKSIVMELAMQTNTSIEWYMQLPFDQLQDWIHTYNNIIGEN